MAMKLIIALTTMAVVAAVPLPDIRSARFCTGWSPFGTDFVSSESPYDYYCRPSSDRRSLTMRVIARDPETAYKYLVMSAVDENGDAVIEGSYKLDGRLRTLSCPDKSRRVLKVDENKVRDIIATYHLPEDKEITLENINCRFAVASSLESYYSDVIINFFGDEVVAQETQNETVTITEAAPKNEQPELTAQRVNDAAVEETNSTSISFNSTEPIAIEDQERQVVAVEVAPDQPTDTTAAVGTEEEKDTTDGDMEHFVPTGTVDQTDDLQQKFENEEKIGKETDNKDTTLTLAAAPDVPEEKEELKNEGEEETFKAEFIMDEFGIKRQVIRENEKKLLYKGQPTGYWCEAFGNTYVMAPGTDCKMFYQTVMVEDDLEVRPLASFNCAPGTRFNANPGKCICVNYQAMVCPETSAAPKPTSSKPETSPILDGTDGSSFNRTETFEPIIENSPTDFNQTSTV